MLSWMIADENFEVAKSNVEVYYMFYYFKCGAIEQNNSKATGNSNLHWSSSYVIVFTGYEDEECLNDGGVFW